MDVQVGGYLARQQPLPEKSAMPANIVGWVRRTNPAHRPSVLSLLYVYCSDSSCNLSRATSAARSAIDTETSPISTASVEVVPAAS